MRRKTISSALIALLLTPLTVNAQKEGRPEWDNEYISGVNKEEISDLCLGSRPYKHISENTTETPEILTLQITTICEAVYFYCQHILARFQIGGQVKFGR